MKLAAHASNRPSHRFAVALALASAWVVAPSTLVAQVVQLPSVGSFGTTGAVSVPDGGEASMGDVRSMRSSVGVQGYGPGRTRVASSQLGANSISMNAVVLDLQAMDEAILNLPPQSGLVASTYPKRTYGDPVMNTLTPKFYARRTGIGHRTITTDPNGYQLALGASGASETGHAGAILKDDSDIRYYMQKAQAAADSGRGAAGRVYYQMAYERLSTQQRTRMEQLQKEGEERAASGKLANSDVDVTNRPAGADPTRSVAPSSDAAPTVPASEASDASPF